MYSSNGWMGNVLPLRMVVVFRLVVLTAQDQTSSRKIAKGSRGVLHYLSVVGLARPVSVSCECP
jgi:hypothetical protein